jgi:queuosine precursor transporter
MHKKIILQKDDNQQSRCLLFLVMAYMAVMLSSGILTSKLILIGSMVTFAGAVVAPFWFIISDIIAEIYGLKIARLVLWYSFFCQLLFSTLCVLLSQAPSPDFWTGQSAYDFITKPLLRITFSAFAAYMISGYLNIYLITKWKILTKGKYFWLRSMGASIIGEAIFTIIAVSMIEFHKAPLDIIIKIILTSYTIKIICSTFFSVPAAIIAQWIKKIDMVNSLENLKS